jgi:hypothetical protein
MSNRLDRDMLCVNAIAWAGTLGVVGMIASDVASGNLHRTGTGLGFIFSAVLLGQMLASGRGLNFGALMAAATAGSFQFWAKPGLLWFVDAVDAGFGRADPGLTHWVELLSLPACIVALSAVLGLMLLSATGSRGVGAQSVLAGAVAATCTLVPGNTVLMLGTAGALWCSIVFLSLSRWGRDYASRASRGAGLVRLGQDGPLASLARGSTHAVPPRPDVA